MALMALLAMAECSLLLPAWHWSRSMARRPMPACVASMGAWNAVAGARSKMSDEKGKRGAISDDGSCPYAWMPLAFVMSRR